MKCNHCNAILLTWSPISLDNQVQGYKCPTCQQVYGLIKATGELMEGGFRPGTIAQLRHKLEKAANELLHNNN